MFSSFAIWLWYTFAGPWRYVEFNEIKAILKSIPNVELVYAWGNEDITFEDIGATIQVKGKGKMTFFSLTRNSFKTTSRICLNSIGPYKFQIEGEGYFGVIETATRKPIRTKSMGDTIEIGSKGEFAQFFPFTLNNVQDTIAQYDNICMILSKWPVAPDKKHFRDKKGRDYYYSIIKSNDERS